MLALTFALPFAAALLCLALNRVAPTRWLGLGASGALLASAALLVAGRAQAGLPLALPERAWALLDTQPVRLALRFDGMSWPFALLGLVGGAVALAALALALPATLRGFGGLFAALLGLALATLLGLSNAEPILTPFAWTLAALLSFVALRASGAASDAGHAPISLAAGLIGALLLIGAALASTGAAAAPPVALICWALAALLVIGAPPFHASVDQPADAPAALAGFLLALGLPLLGGYGLMRFAAGQTGLPQGWRVGLTLIGLLALLICSAGALGAGRARRLVGWQLSAQMGLALMAIGQGGAALGNAAPALLANAALTTLASALALAVLERRAGTDDLSAIRTPGPLALPGLAFLAAAASAIGLPGAWGMWARRWLLDDLLRAAPWSVPPLLAGSALMALAYIAPLAAFWRTGPPSPEQPPRARIALPTLAGPALAALPLLVAGVAPQLAWRGWLSGSQLALAPDAPALAPALPGLPAQIGLGCAAAALLALPYALLRARANAGPPAAEAESAGVLVPQALGQSLRGLAALGAPDALFRRAWDGLLYACRALRRGLALFEQRYYLAGLLIALIVVIMLFI